MSNDLTKQQFKVLTRFDKKEFEKDFLQIWHCPFIKINDYSFSAYHTKIGSYTLDKLDKFIPIIGYSAMIFFEYSQRCDETNINELEKLFDK